jgi:hypothetical protein
MAEKSPAYEVALAKNIEGTETVMARVMFSGFNSETSRQEQIEDTVAENWGLDLIPQIHLLTTREENRIRRANPKRVGYIPTPEVHYINFNKGTYGR